MEYILIAIIIVVVLLAIAMYRKNKEQSGQIKELKSKNTALRNKAYGKRKGGAQ